MIRLGWLSGWLYRKSHVINPASGAGTDYQIRVTVHYGSGSDSGEHVYLNGKCRADFGDIRFTASDGVTQLAYWMQEKVDSDYAVFWVKVSDDLSSNPATIYIYYGKSDATTTSSVDATFIFGDDFRLDTAINTTKWTVNGSPTVSFSATNGLTMTKTSGVATLRSNSTFDFSTHKKVISEFRIDVAGSYEAGIYICPTLTTGDPNAESNWVRSISDGASTVELDKQLAGSKTRLKIVSIDPTVFHKHIVMLKVASTGYIRWILDDTEQYRNASEALYTTTANYLYPYVSAASGYTRSLIIKYVAIAKYVDPEPAHGSWGAEEVSTLTQLNVDASGLDYDDSAVTLTPFTQLNVDENGLDYNDGLVSLSAFTSLNVDDKGLNYDDKPITLSAYTSLNVDEFGLDYGDAAIAPSAYTQLNIDDRGLDYSDAAISLTPPTLNVDEFGLSYVDKTIAVKPVAAAFDLSWLILLIVVAALVAATAISVKKYKQLYNPYMRG